MIALLACCAVGCAPAPATNGGSGAERSAPAGPPPSLTSPNGGETWPPGASVRVTWAPTGGPDAVDLHLLNGQAVVRAIATGTPDDGTHAWLVPMVLEPGADYRVRLTARTGQDESDAAFTIGPPAIAAYFPLTPGRTWTYRDADGERVTATVRAEPAEVNGVAATVLADDTGREDWYAMDDAGLHLHRVVLPDNGQTLTFTPALHVAASQLALRQTIRSAGTVTTTSGGEDAGPLPYSCIVTVDGFPNVPVPAGRFSTIKLGGLLVMGENQRILFTLWLADGVGQVQRTGDRSLALTSYGEGRMPESGK